LGVGSGLRIDRGLRDRERNAVIAVVVTGARGPRKDRPGWTDRGAVWRTLDRLSPSVVVVGDADGVDHAARTWARYRGLGNRLQVFDADWGRYGRRAGPIRNRAMADRAVALRTIGYDVRVFAFHDDIKSSRGTADMLDMAQNRGLRRTLVRHKRKG
jgi:hypothetical protein